MHNRNIHEKPGKKGKAVFWFYSSISYSGYFAPGFELYSKYKQIIRIDSLMGVEQIALKFAAGEVMRRGENVVVALNPLNPDKYEAVAVPNCGVIFMCPEWGCEQGRNIRIENLIANSMEKEDRTVLNIPQKPQMRCFILQRKA